MKYLLFQKGLEDVTFKQTGSGTAFYPYGMLGAGYVVKETDKEKLRVFIRTFYSLATAALLSGVVLMVLMGIIVGWLIACSLLTALLIYYHIGMRRLLANAPKATERLRLADAQRNLARITSTPQIVFGLIVSTALLAMGTSLVWTAFERGDLLPCGIGAACTLFFGANFFVACRLAWLKWDESKA